MASREERLRKLELKQQKEAMQEQIEKIRDQASEKIKELDGEQDAIEKAYEERLKAASLQAEAEKLLMTKSQDEIMDLLYEYVPEYDALGKSMGEKLLEGFQSKVGSIADWFRGFNDQLARMQEELAGSLNAATDRFYESRRDTAGQSGQSGAPVVQQTVNFYEPVESPLAANPMSGQRFSPLAITFAGEKAAVAEPANSPAMSGSAIWRSRRQ